VSALNNIWHLFIKELISLWRDRMLLAFVVYAFSLAIYTQATGISHDLNQVPVGIVDYDNSPLSRAIVDGLLPPRFQTPTRLTPGEVDPGMESARFIFVLVFPPNFEADVSAGRSPALQLLIDATALMQAGLGASDIQSIVNQEIERFVLRDADVPLLPVELRLRVAFNQSLQSSWFTGTMGLINHITMLSILLAGAALIREREHGTLEHLLVLPIRPVEIMLSKVFADGAVILLATAVCVFLVLRGVIGMRISGSVPLFLFGVSLYLFFGTSLGIFLGTMARSMPQFGLMFILIVLPMILLSGGMTPLESMPEWLQTAVQFSPSTRFVTFAQAILYRGAGIGVVWPHFLATFVTGLAFFGVSLIRFRAFLAEQQ